MHVAAKFIDLRGATISAMRVYKDMQATITNAPDEIREQELRLVSPQASRLSGMPTARDPRRGERHIATLIDKIGRNRKKYDDAVEYMAWFKPQWKLLTHEERVILEMYYMQEKQHTGANRNLQSELGYSRSHIDRLRHKALERFIMLLYGL